MEYVIAFIALTAMEIVLGIDNIVFIAIVTGRLPKAQQPRARQIGLLLAMAMRVALLFTLSMMLKMDEPFVELSSFGFPREAWTKSIERQIDDLETTEPTTHKIEEQIYELKAQAHMIDEMDGISGKDLILFAGGLFLIWKSVHEIHQKFEGKGEHTVKAAASFGGVLVSICLMDLVFSIDSVITAVGMVDASGANFWYGIGVMVAAIIVAVMAMLLFAEPVSHFVEDNPTLKMLALAFLLLIGVMLVAEGAGTHFNKGYVYFAMAFALGVELLNLKLRRTFATVPRVTDVVYGVEESEV